MRIVFISDTHGWHEDVALPEGDILVHCGDLVTNVMKGLVSLREVDDWFGRQPFQHVLCTGGNHDRALEQLLQRGETLEHATVLVDAGFRHEGVLFWGAPWIPHLRGWAFCREDAELEQHWSLIPEDVDVLLTHSPPVGILDISSSGRGDVGCDFLADRVRQLAPRIHAFGHIHASYGEYEEGGTRYINAALVGGRAPFTLMNAPIVVEL